MGGCCGVCPWKHDLLCHPGMQFFSAVFHFQILACSSAVRSRSPSMTIAANDRQTSKDEILYAIHEEFIDLLGTNPVDRHVGLRIRMRRKELGISQERLAESQVEFEAALQLKPDLGLAKEAITAIKKRRAETGK